MLNESRTRAPPSGIVGGVPVVPSGANRSDFPSSDPHLVRRRVDDGMAALHPACPCEQRPCVRRSARPRSRGDGFLCVLYIGSEGATGLSGLACMCENACVSAVDM